MATEFYGVYLPGRGLGAATGADEECMDALTPKATYRVVCTRAQRRSIRQNGLLFALISIAQDSYDGDLGKDAVLDVLKLRTGHVRVTQLKSGEMIMAPKSIAFDRMDQDDFNAWFPKAVTVLCRDFCPGLEEHIAAREIEARAAGRRAA